ncbi:MAG: YggS family pyridoxal phosphate-dependent enzyme [Lachnospiraceae bacterium]|nr:YggS family pyridoxal phosphate-dependent enzyme [Lachnospiraceae bacterium]MCR5410040.1 YggS family pyridoxal phosphate-dependent enzyme [Lachnospiraceae bacterium]
MIKENLDAVEKNIEAACKRAGRDRSEVTLIAVSKTKPIEDLMEAYNAGIRVFGENKVQELTYKIEHMPDDIHWHMIGHLQRNKVKYIVGKVDLIHSVDKIELAEEIDKRAKALGIVQDILIEVNIADEESKGGVAADKAKELYVNIQKLSYVNVRGVMCIAPNVDDPESNRQYFVNLRKILVDIMSIMLDNSRVDVMSMGMTGDYEVAIEEGSTMIRVGTGIFGARQYNSE